MLENEKPKEPINDLIKYSIISYNNTIHSSNGLKSFEIIGGPLKLYQITFRIIKKLHHFCMIVKEIKTNQKKKIVIKKLNDTRNDLKLYKSSQNVFVLNERDKTKSKYQNKKLITGSGKHHKSIVKNSRCIPDNK